MQIQRVALWLACLLILPTLMFAQRIEGIILDKRTGKPISGAILEIENIPYHLKSLKDGSFLWEPKAPKVYRITFSHPLYCPKTKEVVLKENRLYSLGIALEPSETRQHDLKLAKSKQRKEALVRIPHSVGLVSQREILRSNARTTPELLMGEAGVWVSKSHHGGGAVHMRGMQGSQTLLAIDGIRLNNSIYPKGPHAYLNQVDILGIDQIEIFKSSGAARYGSDAMGGVINIQTKQPQFSGEGIKVGASSYLKYMGRDMERTGRGEFMISTPNVAVMGGIAQKKFGNLITRKDGPYSVAGSGYDEQAGDVKVQVKMGDKNLITLAHNFVKQDNMNRHDLIQLGRYERYQVSPSRSLSYARFTSIPGKKWANKLELTTSLQRLKDKRVVQLDDATEVKQETDEVSTFGAQFEIYSNPGPFWNAISGLSYYSDEVQSLGTLTQGGNTQEGAGRFPNGANASSLSVYSIHTLDLLKLRLSFGGRANVHSLEAKSQEFGQLKFMPTAVTGHISALYPLDRHNNLFASLNTGYHSPNLYDINGIGFFEGGVEVPNDSLSLERALTTEVGIKSKTDFFSGSVVVYRTRLSRLLERVPSQYLGSMIYQGMPVFQNDHVGSAAVQGIEAELEIPLAKTVSIYGNINYTLGNKISNSEPLSYIPPLNGKLGFLYRNKRGFWGRAEWLYAGQQGDLSPSELQSPFIPTGGTPSWNVLNVLAGYDFKWLSLAAGLQNMFDEAYTLHSSSVNGYGFSVWLSFRFKV